MRALRVRVPQGPGWETQPEALAPIRDSEHPGIPGLGT